MKRSTSLSLLVGAALVGLAAAGSLAPVSAFAETDKGKCESSWQKRHEDHAKKTGQRLDALHKELKLTAQQEAAWTTWSGKVKEKLAAPRDKKDYAAMADLPAPERFAKMVEKGKERQAGMEAALADLKAFYGTLTPEQQKVFDKNQPFGHHGDKGKTKDKAPAPVKG